MQLKNKYYYIYLVVCVFLFAAVWGCQQEGEGPLTVGKPSPRSDNGLRLAELLDAMKMYRFDVVQKAPPFALPSVTGETVSLHQYRGKVVLLSFWATW